MRSEPRSDFLSAYLTPAFLAQRDMSGFVLLGSIMTGSSRENEPISPVVIELAKKYLIGVETDGVMTQMSWSSFMGVFEGDWNSLTSSYDALNDLCMKQHRVVWTMVLTRIEAGSAGGDRLADMEVQGNKALRKAQAGLKFVYDGQLQQLSAL